MELHPRVKEALFHPQRGMEVRGWLKTHHHDALLWRGEDGETMMHWAFLSDWGLALELRDAGLSFEHTDILMRNPFDWLTDRLWGAVIHPATRGALSKGGEERLIRQSEEQAVALWAQGARPHVAKIQEAQHIWLNCGAFEVMPLFLDVYGPHNWLQEGGTALHALVHAPNTSKRARLTDDLIKLLPPDTRDNNGRTPLWHAVDVWLKYPEKRDSILPLVRHLVQKGADPYLEDNTGLSAVGVTEYDKDNAAVLQALGLT